MEYSKFNLGPKVWNGKKYYTASQAAIFLGVLWGTFMQYAKKDIKASAYHGNHSLWLEDDLIKFRKEHPKRKLVKK